MTIQTARPLPECEGCGGPMLRVVYAAQDGLCSDCRRARRRAAVQLEIRERHP